VRFDELGRVRGDEMGTVRVELFKLRDDGRSESIVIEDCIRDLGGDWFSMRPGEFC
jgi:hypothetical protein